MGTRGLVGIKISDYYFGIGNFFDSYLSGIGKKVVDFIRKVNNDKGWKWFKENFNKILIFSADFEVKPEIVIKSSGRILAQNSRECVEDGQFLNGIYQNNVKMLVNEISFIMNIFCKQAYILNMDKMSFDDYRGCQTESSEENDFDLTAETGFDEHLYFTD